MKARDPLGSPPAAAWYLAATVAVVGTMGTVVPLGAADLVEQFRLTGNELTSQADPKATPKTSPTTPTDAAAKAKATAPEFKKLSAIALDIRPAGKLLPPNPAAPFFDRASQNADETARNWAQLEYNWIAPAACYRPLYFEEVGLERHGHSLGIAQPALSSAQFFARSLALPGLMVVQPPRECAYPLGHDRPGDCVEPYWYRPVLAR